MNKLAKLKNAMAGFEKRFLEVYRSWPGITITMHTDGSGSIGYGGLVPRVYKTFDSLKQLVELLEAEIDLGCVRLPDRARGAQTTYDRNPNRIQEQTYTAVWGAAIAPATEEEPVF